MKKNILVLVCCLSLFACDTAPSLDTQNEEVEMEEVKTDVQPQGDIYECYDCYASLNTSYYQVGYSEDDSEIIGIWYWDNSYQEAEKTSLEVLEQSYIEGEIEGWVGEFRFPSSQEITSFTIIETLFSITEEDGFYLEYNYIKTEE